MKIRFDTQEYEVSPYAKTILNFAKENNIPIPSPCFDSQKGLGCCKACIVLANGKEVYACATDLQDGMDIVFLREDLNKLRGERIKAYKAQIKNGQSCKEHEIPLIPVYNRQKSCC